MDKITRNYIECTFAYGKDAKNKASAEELFRSGVDIVLDHSHGFQYASIRDFAPGVKVQLRYNKATKSTIVTV